MTTKAALLPAEKPPEKVEVAVVLVAVKYEVLTLSSKDPIPATDSFQFGEVVPMPTLLLRESTYKVSVSKAKSPATVEVPIPLIVNCPPVDNAPVKVPVEPEKEEPMMLDPVSVAPVRVGLVRVPLVVILVAVLETALPALSAVLSAWAEMRE